jgi:hypothetical protein
MNLYIMFLNFRQSGHTIKTGLIFLAAKELLFFIYHYFTCVCVCLCVHFDFLTS